MLNEHITNPYYYKATLDPARGIESVYDGDTISKMSIDLGFSMTYINSFRLYGIDTPELRTKSKIEKVKGYQARTMLRLLVEGRELRIQSIGKKGTGKYGRILGNLFIQNGVMLDKDGNIEGVKWSNAGLKLIDCGLATPYFGKTKVKDWSKDEKEIEDNEAMIQRYKDQHLQTN